VDHDYLKTLGLEIAVGRDFSREAPADTNAWILNQAAVRHMGLEDPLGRVVEIDGYAGPVVGVARDFHFASLHSRIEPLAIPLQPAAGGTLLLRTSGALDEALDHARTVFDRLTPGDLFQYSFLDEDFDRLYRAEARLSELLGYFSGIAIFIACLGLFGLASFATARRTKEIGVRKVLGASVSSIVGLLSKDFLKLIGIAFAIAVPLSYFTMHRWLEDFAYRIEIGPGVFLLAGTLATVIALATVSYESVRAALADPVKSLRSE
jgi:putative ABC transport system permease protein